MVAQNNFANANYCYIADVASEIVGLNIYSRIFYSWKFIKSFLGRVDDTIPSERLYGLSKKFNTIFILWCRIEAIILTSPVSSE